MGTIFSQNIQSFKNHIEEKYLSHSIIELIKFLDINAFYCYANAVFYKDKVTYRHVAQGESAILTRWMSRVQIPACLPFK